MAGGKPFRLTVVSDVREVIRGNQDIEQSLDQVADALDDVARDGQDAGRDIERALDRTADSLDDTGDAARDAGRDIERHLGEGGEDAARDLERATDRIADGLDETGDAARDAGRDIERHLEDAGKEGEDTADRLEKSFRDAFDKLKAEGRTSTKQVADDTRRNMRDAESATDTFRDEARSNLSESVSSFRGEVEDIPDLVQDVLGGVVADLGPAGAVGAAFAAVGLGLAVKFYEDWKEQAEKVEDRISDMYDDMLESGQDFLSDQFLNTGISAILNNDESALIDYAKAQDIAAKTGLDLTTVIRGYAGESESAAQVAAALNEQIALSDAEFTKGAEAGNDFNAVLAAAGPDLKDYRDTLSEVSEQTATAAEKADAYRGAQLVTHEAVREHIEALAEQRDLVNETREAIAENAKELDNSTERTEANRVALVELVDGLLDVRESAVEAGATTADLTALQARQAEQFLDTAKAAGFEEDAALDLATQLGLIPDEVATRIREQGAQRVIDQADSVAASAQNAAGDYALNFGVNLPSRHQLQSQLNALVWGLNAPAAQVRVRYGQSVE